MNELIDRYEQLLTNIFYLKERYFKPAEFNIFPVFLNSYDEVNFHSRFLTFLLNPNETHGLGNTFLELFLQQHNIPDFDLTCVDAFQEVEKIDILIKNSLNQSIIIENKIEAGDQETQLFRYITSRKKQDKIVYTFYLTLYGDEPSDNSTAGLSNEDKESIKCISYQFDMRNWLLNCIEKSARVNGLREVLIQYLEIVEQITGTNQNENYMNKLAELLSKSDNVLLAYDLQSTLLDCYTEIQFDIWQKIDDEFKKFPEIYKRKTKDVSREAISHYYSKPSHRYGHGLTFKYPEHSDLTLNIMMVDGFEWELKNCDVPKYENILKTIDMKGFKTRNVGFSRISAHNDFKYPYSRDTVEYFNNEQNRINYANLIVNNATTILNKYLEAIC